MQTFPNGTVIPDFDRFPVFQTILVSWNRNGAAKRENRVSPDTSVTYSFLEKKSRVPLDSEFGISFRLNPIKYLDIESSSKRIQNHGLLSTYYE